MTGLLVLLGAGILGTIVLATRKQSFVRGEDAAEAELNRVLQLYGAEYHAFLQGMLLTPEQFSPEQVLQTAAEANRLGFPAISMLLLHRATGGTQ